MAALLDRMNRSDAGFVWLDHDDYAIALLGDGVAPWQDVAAVVALQASALRLLGSDVTMLSLTRVCADWLHAHDDLRAGMGARRRSAFPLKTLLDDERLRTHARELVEALRASQPTRPLALLLPTPRHWLGLAYAQAFAGESIGIDADDADSAAVRVADFLRGFGSAGVDAVLLDEAPDFVPRSDEDIACYRAVSNVAANYRWDLGLRMHGAAEPNVLHAFDYMIATHADASAHALLEVGAAFWNAAQPSRLAPAGARYAVLPADAQPELVLRRLADLRQATRTQPA